ncbi:RsmB/NOP family class I SAM-dependent RNA methyltransferase [Methanopyrus sp. SNP6]|uniref:RsmB/NOP family class I SAM-dependent RNA methyltransferase n=1 Tax=Methanopyrus sp. SNP6 TaxID=1937005 RepID=UPI0011E5EE21|nr:RsmB/NOP family class I SAM-dependent RNA methyltransferase [Methanopyrus sp. SNP6]
MTEFWTRCYALAARSLIEVMRTKSYPVQYILRKTLSEYDDKTQSVTRSMVYDVLRRYGTLERVVDDVSRSELPPLERALVMVAANEVLYEGKHSAPVTDSATRAAKELGLNHRRVHGVVADLEEYEGPEPEDDIDRMCLEYHHPRWFVEKFGALIDEDELKDLMEVHNEPPEYYTFRVNTMVTDVEDVLREFEEHGFEVERGKYVDYCIRVKKGQPLRLEELECWREGHIVPQDEAAALVTEILNPQPGERIADLCAAPGGKTTHIAQLTGDEAEILAVDVSGVRLRRLERFAERMGFENIETLRADVRRLGRNPRYVGKFDRVLLDPPCSSLGTLRSDPDVKWKIGPRDIRELALKQRQLIRAAARLLKPGGVLVYSTCTITPEENELVVSEIIKRDRLRPVDVRSKFKFLHPPLGVDGVSSSLEAGRMWPHVHGTTGFFVAKLKKVA